jgi:hypothetical protein
MTLIRLCDGKKEWEGECERRGMKGKEWKRGSRAGRPVCLFWQLAYQPISMTVICRWDDVT